MVVSEDGKTTNEAYTITPAQYTTKRGKVLDMFLVTLTDELGTSQQRDANAHAREMKGWWDKKAGGFMLRSEEDARKFADKTFGTPIGKTSSVNEIQSQREETDTNPTEAQKEAGNYAKGHFDIDGYKFTLENPKGSTRSGKDASGKEWSITMKYDYGYLNNTEGVDGDHIDVYLSENPTSGNVFVVDKINQHDGSFDEHKVMYGFQSIEDAREAYASQYEKGWKIGTITEVTRNEFKKWVNSSKRKTKPFSEYKSVNKTEREDALSAHGVKIGDKIQYKGKEATIYDADSRQVTLDTGLAPVLYEVTDWENVEIPKHEPSTPRPKKVNVESLMVQLKEKGEAKLSDHTEDVSEEASNKLKQERNEQRKETEQKVAANTEALASEAESKLATARSEKEVNDVAKDIDNVIDKVYDQLALLGYYEAELVDGDFNEAFGYMRNAEKKAVKNVTSLYKTLTEELGIKDPIVYDAKGKKQKSVTANIAPAGGEVTMLFMINRDKGVELI